MAKRISKVRKSVMQEFNRKRRNVMEKVGRIARQTGLERTQLENLIGFDRNQKAEDIGTRELRKINQRMDEITSRDFEPLKMARVNERLRVPNIFESMLNQRIEELEAINGSSLEFSWEDIPDTSYLGTFLRTLDDVMGDYSDISLSSAELISANLKQDYMNLLEVIARRYAVAESIINFLSVIPDEDFLEVYQTGVVPPIFEVVWEDSEQIQEWLAKMGAMISDSFSHGRSREPT